MNGIEDCRQSNHRHYTSLTFFKRKIFITVGMFIKLTFKMIMR